MFSMFIVKIVFKIKSTVVTLLLNKLFFLQYKQMIGELYNLFLKIISIHIEITNLTFNVLMNFLSGFSKSKIIYYSKQGPGCGLARSALALALSLLLTIYYYITFVFI